MNPSLSVVIPAYGRPGPLAETLRSLAGSDLPFAWELIIVDDGSPEPLAPLLEGSFAALPLRIVRQSNTGLIGAKNRGLAEARGELVLFLDSDDLVHPQKLRRQVEDLRGSGADVSYSDVAMLPIGRPLTEAVPGCPYPDPVSIPDPAHFHLQVQPAPHSPMFRREYLQRCLAQPIVPASPIFNPIGEVWMYYNLAPYPARFIKTTGALSIVGLHSGPRITDHWERQGIAAAALMRCFLHRCPDLPHAAAARRLVGRIAFQGWRTLPRGFPREIADIRLEIWRAVGGRSDDLPGGPVFRFLAALIGPAPAARLLKLRHGASYGKIATLPTASLWEFHRRVEDVVAAILLSTPPARSLPPPATR